MTPGRRRTAAAAPSAARCTSARKPLFVVISVTDSMSDSLILAATQREAQAKDNYRALNCRNQNSSVSTHDNDYVLRISSKGRTGKFARMDAHVLTESEVDDKAKIFMQAPHGDDGTLQLRRTCKLTV